LSLSCIAVEIVGCKQILSSHHTSSQQHNVSSSSISPFPLPLSFFNPSSFLSCPLPLVGVETSTMDASPLAQLNNRQQPSFAISPDEISPLWEASQQRQPIRPNPLQRGPFARSYSSSLGSFSSGSSNSIYSNTTSASSSGTGYFDIKSRSKCDLLSPMASLTADMSANFSLDPRSSSPIQCLTAVRAQDFLPRVAPFFPLCHLDHSSGVGDKPFDQQLLMNNIPPPALIPTRLLILRFLINCLQGNPSPHFQRRLFKTSLIEQIVQCAPLSIVSKPNPSARFQVKRHILGSHRHPPIWAHPYSKSQVCINFRFVRQIGTYLI